MAMSLSDRKKVKSVIYDKIPTMLWKFGQVDPRKFVWNVYFNPDIIYTTLCKMQQIYYIHNVVCKCN